MLTDYINRKGEENHKLRAVLSPSPTLSQVSSSVGCLSSPGMNVVSNVIVLCSCSL